MDGVALTTSDDGVSTRAQTVTVRVPMTLRQRGGRKYLITLDGSTRGLEVSAGLLKERSTACRRRATTPIVRALARARRWQSLMDSGEYTSIAALAAAEGIDKSYVSKILRLTLLSPRIVESIIGANDRWQLERLLKPLSVAWREQGASCRVT